MSGIKRKHNEDTNQKKYKKKSVPLNQMMTPNIQILNDDPLEPLPMGNAFGVGKKNKAKRNKKKKEGDVIDYRWKNVERSATDEQQAFFWFRYASLFGEELTSLELLDEVPVSAFVRKDVKVELGEFLRHEVSHLNDPTPANGAPMIILLSKSARDCIDLFKKLKALNVTISKLFPKSGKVSEQEKSLASTVSPIVIGTPHRVATLVENGALSLDQCQLIAIDMSVNVKDMNIIDMNDTAKPLYKFLSTYFFDKLKDGSAHLSFV